MNTQSWFFIWNAALSVGFGYLLAVTYGVRADFNIMLRTTEKTLDRVNAMSSPAAAAEKPKRPRKSKSDSPIKLVPTPLGDSVSAVYAERLVGSERAKLEEKKADGDGGPEGPVAA